MTGATAGEVHTRAVQTIPQAIDQACGFFASRTDGILANHDLDETHQNNWFDVSDHAAVYEELLDTTGANTVRRIGKELAATYDRTETPSTVPDALATLDAAYHDLHRGTVGGYDFKRIGAESGRLVCKTPYPVALEEGLIRGIGQRFSDTGFTKTTVVETHREDGLAVTTMDVEWWQSPDISTEVAADTTATGRGHVSAD